MPRYQLVPAQKPLTRRELLRNPVLPAKVSFGLWGGVNEGRDPFGGAVRKWSLDRCLDYCQEEGISGTCSHDGDLLSDDAPPATRTRVLTTFSRKLRNHGLVASGYTGNLFSHKIFRAGAFTSTSASARRAAIIKCSRAMDEANQLGVEYFIIWGGREGTEVGEQDSGEAVKYFMECARFCILYAIEKGYTFTISFEPKMYEPRFDLYLGTGGSMAAALLHFFPEPEILARLGINLEVPQHLSMGTLNPWLDLGLLLQIGLAAPVLHLGGQTPGRMDCDFGQGVGRTIYFDDFMIRKTLHLHGWRGWNEFDCRPLRTTIEQESLKKFLRHNVRYLRTMERKLQTYLDDPTVRELELEIFGESDPALEGAMAVSRKPLPPIKEFGVGNTWGCCNALENLRRGFPGFDQAAKKVRTDAIEELNYRTCDILLGDLPANAKKAACGCGKHCKRR